MDISIGKKQRVCLRQLLARGDGSHGEQADGHHVGVSVATADGLHVQVWVAAVVDEPGNVTLVPRTQHKPAKAAWRIALL